MKPVEPVSDRSSLARLAAAEKLGDDARALIREPLLRIARALQANGRCIESAASGKDSEFGLGEYLTMFDEMLASHAELQAKLQPLADALPAESTVPRDSVPAQMGEVK